MGGGNGNQTTQRRVAAHKYKKESLDSKSIIISDEEELSLKEKKKIHKEQINHNRFLPSSTCSP